MYSDRITQKMLRSRGGELPANSALSTCNCGNFLLVAFIDLGSKSALLLHDCLLQVISIMAIYVTSRMRIRIKHQQHATMLTFTFSLSEAICLTRLVICSSGDCKHWRNQNHTSEAGLNLYHVLSFPASHKLPNLSSQKKWNPIVHVPEMKW